MQKIRLDQHLAAQGLVQSRSQAENYIKLGYVTVNKEVVTKSGFMVGERDQVKLTIEQQYVSRAALKLASVAQLLKVDFKGKTVLDVGSSTGGFTQYALKQGAVKVIAVEVGTNQLHPSLRTEPRIELHEQTDIRDVKALTTPANIVVMDVSFISLREILPSVMKLVAPSSQIVAMVKPQFEAGNDIKHKGVIKNDRMRRDILQSFETWAKQHFVIVDKADSEVAGTKGNRERFYLLKKLR